jgi:hypothetical protein
VRYRSERRRRKREGAEKEGERRQRRGRKPRLSGGRGEVVRQEAVKCRHRPAFGTNLYIVKKGEIRRRREGRRGREATRRQQEDGEGGGGAGGRRSTGGEKLPSQSGETEQVPQAVKQRQTETQEPMPPNVSTIRRPRAPACLCQARVTGQQSRQRVEIMDAENRCRKVQGYTTGEGREKREERRGGREGGGGWKKNKGTTHECAVQGFLTRHPHPTVRGEKGSNDEREVRQYGQLFTQGHETLYS